MVHLDERYAKYRDKGLMVIALTNEPRGLVDKFVEETKAKHPIVIESGDSLRAYGGTGYPTIVLIGPDGRVLGGNPSDQQIEAALTKAVPFPSLTGKAADAAEKHLAKNRYADARAALEKIAADEKASEDDRKSAQAGVTWIDTLGTRRLEYAAADATAGDFGSAASTYESVADAYKGLPQSEDAKKALAELLSDPARKKEVDAAKKWATVKAKIADEKPKKAIPMVKGFVNSFKGTRAGDEAEKVLEGLRAKDK